MFHFNAKKIRKYDLEDYDNFDVNAAADAPKGRSNYRYRKLGSRKRQKSPCYQLEPPRRQRWRDIPAGQVNNFSKAPSIQTINTSVVGSVMSITSSLSSDSSSSGSRLLISEPSRSYSRNTMNGLQSPWTSTSSLFLKRKSNLLPRYFFKFN